MKGRIGIPELLIILALALSTSAEWSEWGLYGECSRPCGGGLSNRTRTCLGDSNTCDGTNIRFKTCNKQDCMNGEARTLRELQCQSYNNVSLKENLFHWRPHYDSRNPCALYCETVETGFVLKMQQHAMNGTSCGDRGSGVCIYGTCKAVGCDDIVGSKREVDRCGVCGGDGESCDQSLPRDHIRRHAHPTGIAEIARWDVRWGACSKSCGDGVQSSSVVCWSRSNNSEVLETYCGHMPKPVTPPTRPCANNVSCYFRWHAFKWGSCSRTCGEGLRYRRVMCLKQQTSGKPKHVPDRKCADVKPSMNAQCNMGDCPEWLTGPWSPCSVSCGFGEQKRKVVCRAKSVDSCESAHKPETEQKCYAGKSCEGYDIEEREGEGTFIQKDDSSVTKHDFFDDERLQELFVFAEFKVTEWGACSVTCGVGYQHRNVTCHKGDNPVPVTECKGQEQPHIKRECHNKACLSDVTTATSLMWKHGPFKPCSQTCGGGTQSSLVDCVDQRTNRTVLDLLCGEQLKPPPDTRSCNRIECPPEWKVSEYGDCSVPCGGGKQSREVDCVLTTSYGGLKAVPAYRCPDPVPLSERSCNLQFCQAEWGTGNWGECSVTCGLGVEQRSVFCFKVFKDGLHVNVSDVECLGLRPPTLRQCHFGECYQLQQLPLIQEQKGTFIQIKRTKRIQLFVGETAILLPNQAVKIQCPVKNFQRRLIFWTKNRRLIPLVGRVRVSSNGALRITRANPQTDAGIYTCSAGTLHGQITVTFQSKAEANAQAKEILNNILIENFNESFINRPQSDSTFKMRNTEFFKVNSINEDSGYDYSSFTMTNWSECSAKCGWGTQTRVVTCNHVTDKFIRLLPEEECLKMGLSRPTSSRKCVIEEECPSWVVTGWSECSVDNCRKDGFALHRRSVNCQFKNGSDVDDVKCLKGGAGVRPDNKELCKNIDCKAVWKTSEWSECSPECGTEGMKHRTLMCVWGTTGTPAQFICDGKPRPSVSKSCKLQPCSSYVCKDRSSLCEKFVRLNMCRYVAFRRKCCASCKNSNVSWS
ncbi:ADAMTS-like protein 1 isoform X4 [Dreissena polymorpha]|uniref:ADAMTS-like protein 1 isoform X4 n=1 Tax=Dreissena polymorpha TaxID=45954 RepID=UPI002264A8E6|nr:ADAMTS-like protein 1 isoform X4 [Dreissena polymorpha]